MPVSPVILIHLVTALAALLLGAMLLFLKKGSTAHRLAGRIWVAAMVVTALVSFGIQRSGHWSVIHLLSVLTLVVLFLAIRAVLRGNVRSHERYMRGAYAGLATAGLFTLLPGRLLGQFVWHNLGLA